MQKGQFILHNGGNKPQSKNFLKKAEKFSGHRGKAPRRELSAASQYCVLRQIPSAFRQKSLSGKVFSGKISEKESA
jgi:hypothetical protein